MAESEDAERSLVLSDLLDGLPKLSPVLAGALAEAASVCLERYGHPDNVRMSVTGDYPVRYLVERLAVTDQHRDSYTDTEEATEWGACGIAILMILDLTNYTVVQRAVKNTGFDYWLGEREDPILQKKARLEVSGIGIGTEGNIRTRAQRKHRQTTKSDALQMEAIVVIVEFSTPAAHMESRMKVNTNDIAK